VGIELKPSYYRQAVKNCEIAARRMAQEVLPMEYRDNTKAEPRAQRE